MRTTPSLALIIPNYNDSKHIIRCLRSILEQDVRPDEIIVVDDCSTDNSIEVIRAEIARHPEVVLIQSPKNLGTYGALDNGSRQVTSDYIMFISANDFVFPGIFAHAKSCIAQHPGVGLWSAMGWLVDKNDRPIGPLALAVPALRDRYFTPTECIHLAKKFGNWFAGPSVVYHKETLEMVGRFNPDYKGLADLIAALMVASKRGAIFSPVPYVAFRLHEGNLSNTFAKPELLIDLLKNLIEKGPQIAPELFDKKFCERTISRIIFTAIRQSRGNNLGKFQSVLQKNEGNFLGLTERTIPIRFKLTRSILAFIVLRHFDILPSLWNRLLGTTLVSTIKHKDFIGKMLNNHIN